MDSWSLKKKERKEGVTYEDVYMGKHEIKTVDKYEYLGNTLECRGSNEDTINDRVGKGQGAIRDIKQILEG